MLSKKNVCICVLFFLFSIPCIVYGDIPKDKIDSLSKRDKDRLSTKVSVAIITKKAGVDSSIYSDILDKDLSDYSIKELEEIREYLSKEKDEKDNDIEYVVSEKPFTSEQNAVFSIYEAVADMGHQLGYVVQNNNPELLFNDNFQSVDICRLYLTYYGETTKEDARDTLEKYTDDIIDALCNGFPKVGFEIIDVCWKIPAIDEDNLYAASYWCEQNNDNGEVVRGEGKGIIYY